MVILMQLASPTPYCGRYDGALLLRSNRRPHTYHLYTLLTLTLTTERGMDIGDYTHNFVEHDHRTPPPQHGLRHTTVSFAPVTLYWTSRRVHSYRRWDRPGQRDVDKAWIPQANTALLVAWTVLQQTLNTFNNITHFTTPRVVVPPHAPSTLVVFPLPDNAGRPVLFLPHFGSTTAAFR